MKVLYSDKDIAVVIKPAGVSSQASHDFNDDMVSLIRKELGCTEVYVVHRLDQMVSGVMVYALNKDAAAKLSAQAAGGGFNKKYQALLDGIPKEKKGELTDYLVKDETSNLSRVCTPKTKGAREAKLTYKVIESKFTGGKDGRQLCKVEVGLITGRHHQIRVQFGSRGCPIIGDVKYGYKGEAEPIALAAVELAFSHPKTKKAMRYTYDWDRNIS
ncbi:MAG: RluA family pseudouridine synthase [Lachnospiraceae bacterium]|nr:RluA family pseudouridine synthase [Candidatus Darwinimomas equi]